VVQAACDVWVEYEREHGLTLEAVEVALIKTTARRSQLAARAAKAATAYPPAESATGVSEHGGMEQHAPGGEDYGHGRGAGGAKRAQKRGSEDGGGEGDKRAAKRARKEKPPPASQGEEAAVEQGDPRVVFVRKIDPDLTEEEVREALQDMVGPVERLQLLKDKYGKSRGMAEVTFAAQEDAAKAIGRWTMIAPTPWGTSNRTLCDDRIMM
jgi:hypothetical protein